MKIGILGSGTVGQQLGIGFVKIGHEVKIGTRDSSKLNEWLNSVGNNGSVGSFEEAANFGDFIVIATLWKGTESAIEQSKQENFANKVVIDVTNPLDFSEGSPKFAVTIGNSAGEIVQRLLPNSKVVKAFNFIGAHIMCNPKREEGMPTFFVAGDDQEAKELVMSFAKEFGWQEVVDMGNIEQAYWLEALAMFWINFGMKYNNWTHAFKLLKKQQ